MSPLGLILKEFLEADPDVTCVQDVSTSTLCGAPVSEELTCRMNGCRYRITVNTDPRD